MREKPGAIRHTTINTILFLVVACAFAISFLGASVQVRGDTTASKIPAKETPCYPDAFGEETARDEKITKKQGEVKAGERSTETKSECVPKRNLKDSKGKQCKTGRVSYTKFGSDKEVILCKEDVDEKTCNIEQGCSPKTMQSLSQRQVPVEESSKTSGLRNALFRVSEHCAGTTYDPSCREQIAQLSKQLEAAQAHDIQKALDKAFGYGTDYPSLGATNDTMTPEGIARHFSGLTSNCEGGSVCVQEVVRVAPDSEGTKYLVPISGAPIAALSADRETAKQFEHSLRESGADKAWYSAARDTFMQPDSYDLFLGQPKELDRPLFDALQRFGSDLYHVPDMARAISEKTFGKLVVNPDTPFFQRTSIDILGREAMNAPPIEASQFAREMAQVYGELSRLPPELFKSPLLSNRSLSIFGFNETDTGNARIALFSPPEGLAGTLTHEFGHNVIGELGLRTGSAFDEALSAKTLSQYLYGQNIGYRSADLTQSVLLGTPLGSYAQTNISERLAEAFTVYAEDPLRFAHYAAAQGPDSEAARLLNVMDAALYAHGVETPLWARPVPYSFADRSPLALPGSGTAFQLVPGEGWYDETRQLACRLFASYRTSGGC